MPKLTSVSNQNFQYPEFCIRMKKSNFAFQILQYLAEIRFLEGNSTFD